MKVSLRAAMMFLICSGLVLALVVGCSKPGEEAPPKASESNEVRAQMLFDEGGELFNKGQYDGAIEKYKEGIDLLECSAQGHNLLGMGYRFKYNQTGDLSFRVLEERAFLKSLECDPGFWPAQVNLGATYYYQGKKAEAVPYFEKALKANPHHPEREQIEQMIADAKAPESAPSAPGGSEEKGEEPPALE